MWLLRLPALLASVLPVFVQPILAASGPALPCGVALTLSDVGFGNATFIDNGGAGRLRQPALVVLAKCAEDIPVAMQYARANKLGFAVKGGGHSAAGYSLAPGGLVLDMSLMNASRVDRDPATGAPTLWVQAGALFGDLYARLNGTGLLVAGGGCSTVGVCGFVLGGGLSFLSRAFGLAIDNLVRVRIVLANGNLLSVSGDDPSQADLWWALRGGGGGNFGVVVELTLRLHSGEEQTTTAEVCWRGANASIAALPLYSSWLEPADANEARSAAAHADPRVGAPGLLMRNAITHDVDFCVTLFGTADVNVTQQVDSLVAFVQSSIPAQVVTDGCAGPAATYYEWESRCGALKTGVDGDDGYMTSGVLAPGALADGVAATLLVTALAGTPGDRTIINFHDGGGAQRSPAGGGSFPYRNYNLVYQVKGIWIPGGANKSAANVKWGVDLQRSLGPYISGAYVNYIDPLQWDWLTTYYGANYARLEQVKTAVDPHGFFVFNQSIGLTEAPAPTPASAPAPAQPNCSADILVERMYAFQVGQNSRDALALALMYTVDGANYIPAPAAPIMGRAAIQQSFAAYFATLESINETVVGPIIVNGNMGAFSKSIVTLPKAGSHLAGGAVVTQVVVNWFEFDCATSPPLIATFRAMFNSSTTVSFV